MLTSYDKQILREFKQTKIPSIFKLDKTDNILYVEHVDFDLCDLLLRHKKVDSTVIKKELMIFQYFYLN